MLIPVVLLFSLTVSAARTDRVAPASTTPETIQPRVSDPLLTPVQRPGREIRTWGEAHALLVQGSTSDRSALAAIESAEGRWRQALSPLLPRAQASALVAYDALRPAQLNLSNVNVDTGGARVPLLATNFNVSQSVIDASTWLGVRAASERTDGARAQLEDGRRRLTQGLARTLIAVVAAERVAELNRVGLRQAHERAGLVERIRQLGAGTQIDVVRTKQDVYLARGTLVAGDEALHRAREALALALGIPDEVGVAPDFVLDGLVDELKRQCPAIPWEQRADLVAAHATIDATRDAKRQAQLGYVPTLGVSTVLLASGPSRLRLSSWNLLATLSMPLWEGGNREGLVTERSGLERQAEEALEATRRTTRLEVRQARRALAVGEALLATATDARTSAAELDLLLRRSFEVGRGNSLELVQSAVSLRQADIALAIREYELVQARLDVMLTEARCNW